MNGLALITNAYYTSGVVGREFEAPTDTEITDGLTLLNQLLSEKRQKGQFLPYFTQFDFNMVIGQESYDIPNLIEVDTLTFNIGPVRYNMVPVGRRDYFGNFRVDNVTTLPAEYYVERNKGGSQLFVYPVPAEAYASKIHGKFAILAVGLFDDLNDQIEDYYIIYLTYALAEVICHFHSLPFSPDKKSKLIEMESELFKISPSDLSTQSFNLFPVQSMGYWGFVNLYNGWVP
jgi:hypothetical protein